MLYTQEFMTETRLIKNPWWRVSLLQYAKALTTRTSVVHSLINQSIFDGM